MKKGSLRLLLLSYVLLLAGCTSQLYMKTVEPAAFALSAENKKLLLFYLPAPSPLSKQGTDQTYLFKDGESEDLYQTAAQQALASASTIFRKDLSTKVEVLGKSALDSLLGKQKHLGPENLPGLSQKYNASHIIVLQAISAKSTKGYDGINDYSEGMRHPILTSRSTASNEISYYLNVKAQWALYNSQGKVVDSLSLSVSKPVIINEAMSKKTSLSGRVPVIIEEGIPLKLLGGKPSVKESMETLQWAAQASGEAMAQRYYPQQRVVNRPYYHAGPLAEAAEWIKVKNWKEATTLLLPLAANGPGSLAGKAAYNIALLYEAQGQVEEAKLWAEQAAQKGDKNAVLMLRELNRM